MFCIVRGFHVREEHITLTLSESNVRNADGSRYWFKTTYRENDPLKKALYAFFYDALCGEVQFYKSSPLKAAKIVREMQKIYQNNTPDIYLEKDYALDCEFVHTAYVHLARNYGVPKFLGEKPADVESGLRKINEQAKQTYKAQLCEYAEKKIILMETARYVPEHHEYCEFFKSPVDCNCPYDHLIGLTERYDNHGKYDNKDKSLRVIPKEMSAQDFAEKFLIPTQSMFTSRQHATED